MYSNNVKILSPSHKIMLLNWIGPRSGHVVPPLPVTYVVLIISDVLSLFCSMRDILSHTVYRCGCGP